MITDITTILYSEAAEKSVPLGGTFELTPLCNMNCKMCYIRMSKEEMEKTGRMRSAAEWLKIAEKAKEMGLLFLLLTGGEPFLYPEFWELYTKLKEMGIMVSINSNATMLDDETLEKLINNPPYRINVTIYGGCDNTYKELCRYDTGYTKATNAVRKLKKAGVNVKINGSITPFNCSDIDSCLNFAKEVQAPVQLGSYMFPPMRREDKSTGRFTAEEAGIYQAIIDKKRMESDELEATKSRIRTCNENGSVNPFPTSFRCRAGRSSFWINWKGEMLACGMMENIVAHPFEQGFEQSWKYVNSTIKSITALKGCEGCKYTDICKICPAMAMAETGTFNGKPDYICTMMNKWTEEMLR